jgi:hypothetical protein
VYWINHEPVLLPEFVYESLVAPLVSCSLNFNNQQNKKIPFELSFEMEMNWRAHSCNFRKMAAGSALTSNAYVPSIQNIITKIMIAE